MSDDGGWLHRVTSPKHEHAKVYELTLADAMDSDAQEKAVKKVAEGILLEGDFEPTKPAVLEFIDENHARLTLEQGKYHQVKRMMGYFGGIKLGAGGLTRAYAGAAQAAVDEMILSPYVPMAQVQVLATFATEAQCRYIIESLGGHIDDVAYSKQVTLSATLAEADINKLRERLAMDGRVLDQPEG